jgi:hypothetical protein
MKITLFILMLFTISVEAQNCINFNEGTFEQKGDFGTIRMERKGEWQLEKSVEYGIVYLNKIEKISECEFITRHFKIIEKGVLPKPDVRVFATTDIVEVIGNEFIFKSTFSGTETTMEGKYVKVSDDISKEFKSLIDNEKND